MLGGQVKRLPVFGGSFAHAAVVGWGLKENTRKARAFAQKQQLPYWQLEDGFISYLGHPGFGDRRFALIADKTGIYYDARQPSDIENLLNRSEWQSPELLDRARKLLATICQHNISKYNHEPVGAQNGQLRAGSKNKVLVVDQTYGDCSVEFGMANEASFQAMLACAVDENPTAEIWVKVHPDVVLGKKRGYFALEPCGTRIKGVHNDRVRVLAEQVNAQSLFPYFSKVYVVTSQLGFEALWHQKTVVCFGVPFYSHWGLTDDRAACSRRLARHSVESLFAAACLLYTRYIHPETHSPCELEEVLDLIILQQSYRQNRVATLYALGFSLWKRAFISRFAEGLADRVVYVGREHQLHQRIQDGDGVLIWGMNTLRVPLTVSAAVWRMEDGFIRSCGLGAELRRPGSLVLDSQGIYYNATQPSDLEQSLNTMELPALALSRGQALIQLLLEQRVSKYNLTGMKADPFQGARDKQLKVLVTGQVDSDASLKFGSPEVAKNSELLRRVRESLHGKEAMVVYKPHPDVVQAGRSGHVPEQEALKWADKVVTDIDIFDCIAACDELHVMSSQAGFEALLQHKTVHCWGIPFYSGWGLTIDHMVCERRRKKRTLAELVYIALCYYPRYIHWGTRRFTTPERLIQQLACERGNSKKTHSKSLAWLGRKRRKLMFLWEALRA